MGRLAVCTLFALILPTRTHMDAHTGGEVGRQDVDVGLQNAEVEESEWSVA